jgi:hypothetical protein
MYKESGAPSVITLFILSCFKAKVATCLFLCFEDCSLYYLATFSLPIPPHILHLRTTTQNTLIEEKVRISLMTFS